jgi:hypothetical protein
VDENGTPWVKDGLIDLSPYGFRDIAKPTIH